METQKTTNNESNFEVEQNWKNQALLTSDYTRKFRDKPMHLNKGVKNILWKKYY